jgi:hypothetical protein
MNVCTNCKYFLPNASMGLCLQFYKRSATLLDITPRSANYCRNIEQLCGKKGKYFVPNNLSGLYIHHTPKIENFK